MSFLKEFFEKRKDSKYGKGHKLGTSSEESERANSAMASARSAVQNRPATSQYMTQNEASKKAAEAALARAQAQSILNKPMLKHIYIYYFICLIKIGFKAGLLHL